MTESETNASSDKGARHSKSTLFCPVCGHESPIDGDWIVRDGARSNAVRSSVYLCPECGAVIEERSVFEPACVC